MLGDLSRSHCLEGRGVGGGEGWHLLRVVYLTLKPWATETHFWTLKAAGGGVRGGLGE